MHVAADAATSLLAIAALTGGKYLGATWLDPLMGIIGSVIVAAWAATLLRDTGRILLDAEMVTSPVVAHIRRAVCGGNTGRTIEDLHVWRVGKGKFACVLSVVCADGISPDEIRALLSKHEELARHGRGQPADSSPDAAGCRRNAPGRDRGWAGFST